MVRASGKKTKLLTLSVAESMTGGLISHLLTNRPGSSKWFKGGIIAYTNEVKSNVLGVPKVVLERYGAVSAETAAAMAAAIRKKLKSDVGLSITGLAGPTGGTKKTPVGTVFIGVAAGNEVIVTGLKLKGSRRAIKEKAAMEAAKALLKHI